MVITGIGGLLLNIAFALWVLFSVSFVVILLMGLYHIMVKGK